MLEPLRLRFENDANFSATFTNVLPGKLAKASNLSDLADAAAACISLGLRTIAVHNASAIAITITGGSVDGVTLDGGTF